LTARPGRVAGAALALALSACLHPPPPRDAREPAPHVEPDLVGVVHVVRRGETIYRIARTYGVEPRELMDVNGLADARQLEVGMELFIPGATRELPVPAKGERLAATSTSNATATPNANANANRTSTSTTDGEEEALDIPAAPAKASPRLAQARERALRWPVDGVLYSRYGVRQGQRHDGIDIAAPEGTAIGAAADGAVVYAGRQSGYGEVVILRHGGDLLTVYAHASAILVKQGDRVAAGQPIARVGRSGRTTGPHLHFEVREGTRPANPLLFLR
jgi:lipoprotein NlpD